jgi:cobalt/nickel transport system permease protein
MFGMTLVRSWNRAARGHNAMLLRGFEGRLIPLEQQTVGRSDIAFLVIALTIVSTIGLIPFLYSCKPKIIRDSLQYHQAALKRIPP